MASTVGVTAAAAAVATLAGATAPPAAIQRAVALVQQQRTNEAIDLLERLSAKYPGDPAPYNELAIIYARRNDLGRAQALLVAAIKAEPRYGLVYRNLQSILGSIASRAYDQALLGTAGSRPPPTLASFADSNLLIAANTSPPAPEVEVKLPTPEKAAAPTVQPATKAEAAAAAPAVSPVSSPKTPRSQVNNVVATVLTWAKAWSAQDIELYLKFYGPQFTPSRGLSHALWREQRRQRLAGPTFIKVEVKDINISFSAPNRATARFTQFYRSNSLASTVTKELRLSHGKNGWKITRESVTS